MNASRTSSFLPFIAAIGLIAGLMSQSASADFDWGSPYGTPNGNWITSVKNQFGETCWAFGSVGTMEAKYMLTRNDNSGYQPDMSEQQLVWETDPNLGDNTGGQEGQALEYMTTHGVVLDSVVPHDGSHENTPAAYPADPWPLTSVFPSPDNWTNHVFKGVSYVDSVTSTKAGIQAALKLDGPLCVTLYASWDLYSSVADLKASYRGLVSSKGASYIDHAVVLVGYYDDPSCPTQGYWVIKNSWGTGEGVSGYDVVPYGILEEKNRTHAETGPVYYTGTMLSGTWTGTTNSYWTTSAYPSNWSTGLKWVNQETQATFDATATNRTIGIINPVIAHQLIFNASGYTLNNGSNGALTVTAGGIQANQSVTINVPVTVGAPQTWTTASGMTLNITGAVHTIISNLTIDGGGNTSIGGPIDGGGVINSYGGAAPGNLIKNGAGTLTLGGASNYPGTITIGGGVLNFAPVSGATATYSGVISYSGAIQKNDLGTVVLSAANANFSGPIAVNQGQLTFTNTLSLGTTVATTISGGQVNANVTGTNTISEPFTINNGGVLNQMTGADTYNGAITCTGTAEVRNSGGSMTLSSGISGNMAGGALTLNGVSGNTLTLMGALNVSNNAGVTFSNGTTILNATTNSWAGGATITNGTLKPTKANNLPSGTTVALNGGTLNLNGYSQSIAGITSLVPASDLVTSLGSCTLTVAPTADTTYAGQLSGPINLTKNGTSKFILSGNNTLSASITTTINGGTLQIGAGGTAGGIAGNVSDNGTLTFSRSDNVTFSGNISGSSGSLVKQGANVLTLTGANTYGGGTTINGGTLRIGNGGTSGSLAGAVTNNGTLAFARSDDTGFSGDVTGSGGVTKYGTNRLNLTGANSYVGVTAVAGGTLELGPSAQGCVLNRGGADIQGGKMVFDYAGIADPATTIQGLLNASYHNGLWDTGQFKDSTVATTGLTLGWIDDAATSTVTVMATYPGDFNLDGAMNSLDRDIWFANAFSGTTTWRQGDANYDGVVNGLDLDLWKAHASLPPLAGASPCGSSAVGASVPEPGTLALLAAGLIGLLAYGWRKRE